MPIRQFKPVTASSRFRSVSDFTEITRTTPEKSLLEPLKKSGGRDNHGHISMRRIGGGAKRKYRIIDFKRNKFGVAGTVKEIEYDPNRSARIALVEYADGERRYIIHPKRSEEHTSELQSQFHLVCRLLLEKKKKKKKNR